MLTKVKKKTLSITDKALKGGRSAIKKLIAERKKIMITLSYPEKEK